MTLQRPPEHGPQFEAMMSQIDLKLTNDGVDIPGRPILAIREVSLVYNLNIPIGGDRARMPLDLRENAALGEAINNWYRNNYGDRLKTNPSPGKMVVLLDGDLYVLRAPRIFGTVEFFLKRDWLDSPAISRGPVSCNIVQLVDDMTPARASRLSDSSLKTLGVAFNTLMKAAYTLECTQHPFMAIARGDIEVAVGNLMARECRYGESKWASLQAAEKILKAAIELANGKFGHTHDLSKLCDTLASTGLEFDLGERIPLVQCSPAIRYGQEPCCRDEALVAHQTSLEILNTLSDAGARFKRGIGGLRT